MVVSFLFFLSGLISKFAIWTSVLLFTGYQPSIGDNPEVDDISTLIKSADITILDGGHTLGVAQLDGSTFHVRRLERDGDDENVIEEGTFEGLFPRLATAGDGTTMLVYNYDGDVKYRIRDPLGVWGAEGVVESGFFALVPVLKGARVSGDFWVLLFNGDDHLIAKKYENSDWEEIFDKDDVDADDAINFQIALKESSPAKVLFSFEDYYDKVSNNSRAWFAYYDEELGEVFGESVNDNVFSHTFNIGFGCFGDKGGINPVVVWVNRDENKIKTSWFDTRDEEPNNWSLDDPIDIETFTDQSLFLGLKMACDPSTGCCALAWSRVVGEIERSYIETKSYNCALDQWGQVVRVAEIEGLFADPELAVDEDGQFTLVWQLLTNEDNRFLMTAASDECGKSWSQGALLEWGGDLLRKHKLVVRKNMAKILVEAKGADLPTGEDPIPTSNYYVFDRTTQSPCDKHSYKAFVQKSNFNYFGGLSSYLDWSNLRLPENFNLKFFQSVEMENFIHHKERDFGGDRYLLDIEDSNGNRLFGPFEVNCK